MTKRAYPFDMEESFQSQHKIHVGLRQVNEGVMKAKNMSQVYDRTLKMLFSGSKGVLKDKNTLDSLNNNIDTKMETSNAQKSSNITLKQMELTPQGKLLMPEKNLSHINNDNKFNPSLIACKYCKENQSSCYLKCNYCELSQCESCFRICTRCCKGFCIACSFVVYEKNVDQAFCLNCF